MNPKEATTDAGREHLWGVAKRAGRIAEAARTRGGARSGNDAAGGKNRSSHSRHSQFTTQGKSMQAVKTSNHAQPFLPLHGTLSR